MNAKEYARVLDDHGARRVSLSQMEQELATIGYQIDRTMDCRCTARILTGPLAGETYPCLTTGINQADDGVGAFNVNARRDENYSRLKVLRGAVYAIVCGRVLLL